MSRLQGIRKTIDFVAEADPARPALAREQLEIRAGGVALDQLVLFVRLAAVLTAWSEDHLTYVMCTNSRVSALAEQIDLRALARCRAHAGDESVAGLVLLEPDEGSAGVLKPHARITSRSCGSIEETIHRNSHESAAAILLAGG